MNIEPIKATFEIIRVQTMADGAVRIVFEASEDRTDLLKAFADVKRGGGLIEAVMLAVQVESLTELDDETEKEAERDSSNMGSRRTTNRRDQ